LVLTGALLAVAAVATVLFIRDPAPRAARFRPPPGTVYLGVSTDAARLDTFRRAAGLSRPGGLYGRWTTPDGPFEPVLTDALRAGMTPVVHWNLPLDGNQVAGGRKDDYLRAQAAAVRSFGRPVFVRLDWEFNSTAYPHWTLPAVTPQQFVRSWRHVVELFGAVPNVAFVWAPTTWPGPGGRRVSEWWPGDDVVDWVGLDAYPQSAPPDYLLRGPDGMQDMAAFAVVHGKPLMLAEWAPDLPSPDTAAPVDLVLDWADRNPVVQALVYFDFAVDGKDYTLAHHPVGAAEFRRRTANRRFLTEVVG
jgi:hypothetical protein